MIKRAITLNSRIIKKDYKRREIITAWILSGPALSLMVVFLIAPFVIAFGFSITDQRLVPNLNLPTQFVGFRNFIRLLLDVNFHQALLNNFIFAAIVVPIQTLFALFLAIMVNYKLRFINFFRAVYFSPVVITMVVVSIIWTFLYNPGEGFINQFLSTISGGLLGPYGWLNDVQLALPAIAVLSIWQGVGFQMVIYLAGLQGIPAELYEASQVDGANKWQQFWHITIPQLRNTTIFVVTTTTILAFKLFTQVWVMTQGGPRGATMTTIVILYKEGFLQLRVGYASAISIMFFLIVLCVSMFQRIYLREERMID